MYYTKNRNFTYTCSTRWSCTTETCRLRQNYLRQFLIASKVNCVIRNLSQFLFASIFDCVNRHLCHPVIRHFRQFLIASTVICVIGCQGSNKKGDVSIASKRRNQKLTQMSVDAIENWRKCRMTQMSVDAIENWRNQKLT